MGHTGPGTRPKDVGVEKWRLAKLDPETGPLPKAGLDFGRLEEELGVTMKAALVLGWNPKADDACVDGVEDEMLGLELSIWS